MRGAMTLVMITFLLLRGVALPHLHQGHGEASLPHMHLSVLEPHHHEHGDHGHGNHHHHDHDEDDQVPADKGTVDNALLSDFSACPSQAADVVYLADGAISVVKCQAPPSSSLLFAVIPVEIRALFQLPRYGERHVADGRLLNSRPNLLLHQLRV